MSGSGIRDGLSGSGIRDGLSGSGIHDGLSGGSIRNSLCSDGIRGGFGGGIRSGLCGSLRSGSSSGISRRLINRNSQYAIAQCGKCVVPSHQGAGTGGDRCRADRGGGVCGGSQQRRAAHARCAGVLIVHIAGDGAGEGRIGRAVDAAGVVGGDGESGFVYCQVAARDVVALLGRVVAAAVIARVGSDGGSTQRTGKGGGCAALGCAVVGRSNVGERQAGQEAGEQGCGMAFIDAPHGAAATGVGDVPAGEAGHLLHLGGGEAGYYACQCADLGTNTSRMDVAIPITVADCAIVEVPSNQAADVASATHAASGIAVCDRCGGRIKSIDPNQPADIVASTAHISRGVAVADRAVVVPNQTPNIRITVHAACGITVCNRTEVVPARQPANVLSAAYYSCGVAVGNCA